MNFSPVPKFSFPELTDVTPDFLVGLGIEFLMLDLDNTIAAYNEHLPSDEVASWAASVRNKGIELYIISNSLRKDRCSTFAQELDVRVKMNAHKPSPKYVLQAISEAGYNSGNSALIGDQVFTDTLAANRAGICSIIVKPKQFTNPLLAIRYAAESPFRAMCKNSFSN
ncbi:MAG: YqeG family HAD IIIA-type phosphatase [Oscillospiraceae bacterium]|nr:YqeG family HAD IIIA-type phosphatase [Oscillospiraceae bacterium]